MYYQIDGTSVRIAGSLHRVPAESPQLPGWVSQAYEWSEHLGFEHDASSSEMRAAMVLPPGETVAQRLPKPLYDRVASLWPVHHPLGVLGTQQLWLVMMSLAMSNLRLANGVEPILTARARADGRPISYLETGQEWAALAASIDDARYARIIELTLNTMTENGQRIHDLHAAWLSQRIQALEDLMPRMLLAVDPVIRNAVLDARNRAWIPLILKSLSSTKRLLIAVGALHLVGPNGLVALLEAAGCTLTPVAK
jgi:uncharacterized protein